jgi:G3E family GTPase
VLPVVTAQIEAADRVLVNKVDIHPADVVHELEAELRRVKPGITTERTVLGPTSYDPLAPSQPHQLLSGELTPRRLPSVETWDVPLRDEVDLERLCAKLGALGDELYRAKGFVRSSGQVYLLDHASGRCQLVPASLPSPSTGLALFLYAPPSESARRHLASLGAPSRDAD